MAITRGNTSNGAQSATSSLTVSHTTSAGSNKVLKVNVECQTGDNVTGVTFNGVAMTQFSKVSTTIASYWNYEYILVNPGASTTANIIVSCSGTRRLIALGADYNDVDQTTPLSVATNNITTGTPGTLTLTTTINNAWITGTIRCNSTNPTGAGANTVEVTKNATELGYVFYDSNGPKTPTGSYSINSTFSGSQLYCFLGSQLNPSVASITRVASTSSTTATTSISFASGTQDFVVAFVYKNAGGTLSSPTWNGTAMTQAYTATLPSANNVYVWYILGGATGTQTLAWTGSGVTICVASYLGTKQTGFPDASTSNSGTLSSPTTATLTTVADNCWQIMGIMSADSSTCTASTGATQVVNTLAATGCAIFDSNASLTPAGSKSMAVTFASTATPRAAYYSFSIAPAGSTSTIKSIDGTAQASIKSMDATVLASIKSVDAITN